MSDLSRLPDLPKKHTKREAGITPRVLEWFKTHYNGSCAIEIKATVENTIPMSALQPHQFSALLAATSTSGVVHKISDESRGHKPFDAFMLKRADAYVVACNTQKGICHAIPVKAWRGISFDRPGHEVEFTFEF